MFCNKLCLRPKNWNLGAWETNLTPRNDDGDIPQNDRDQQIPVQRDSCDPEPLVEEEHEDSW